MTLIFKKSTAQPAFTVAAAITGTTEATQTLTCAYTVLRARAANVTVRWYRHTADDGTDPTGAMLGTGSTYTLTGTDVGNYIRAIVTAINPAGTVQSTTSYTAIITAGDPPEPPAIVASAVITGTADVGETLTVSYSFTGQDSVAIQWYSYATEPTGSPLAGTDEVTLGTASTQALTESEAGRWIVAVVTATNAVDSTVTSASVAMAGVDPYAPIAPTQYTVPAYDDSTLTKVYCYAGDDLQAKLNALVPGQCLVLEAGATWTGKFRVPRTNLDSNARATLESAMNPTFDSWAYIISSATESLPAEGSRVEPSDVEYMPKVQSTTFLQNGLNQPQTFTIGVDDGVSKLRIVGLEITTTYNEWNNAQVHMVFCGKSADDEISSDYYGEEIVFDRCYIHSNQAARSRDAMVMYRGCGKVAVIGCRFEWFHGGDEPHGIHIYQTPGPVLVHNNAVITGGICIFMAGNGGGGTFAEGRIPRDVTITKNYIAHRIEYDKTQPEYAYPGKTIVTKNLIESKGSKRVLVRGNVFYRGRGDGQQQGCPWMHQNEGGDGVWDIDFRDNLAVDCGSVQVSNPFDYGRPYGYKRIRFLNNLFALPFTGQGSIYFGGNDQVGVCEYVSFKHNSWVFPGTSVPKYAMFFGQSQTLSTSITGLLFEDNIIRQGVNSIGIGATGLATGRPAPLFHAPGGFDFNNNVAVGSSLSQYSTTYDDWRNWRRPSSNTTVGFVNTDFSQLGHFALAPESPYKAAGLDGTDIGADISAIAAQINASDNPFGA